MMKQEENKFNEIDNYVGEYICPKCGKPANGYNLYFYTHYNQDRHRNDMEIDFIISNGSKLKPKINPIEVKSSKKYTAKSITAFKDKYQSRIGEAYIIHPKNFKIEDGIIYIPAYMAFCL